MNLGTKLSFAGSECYSVYKASQEPITPTTADVVIPYIADTIVGIVVFSNGYGLMGVVSSIVAADWISRAIIDMVPSEVKEEYIDYVVGFIAESSIYF
jgi:hypothetical protein